MAALQRGSFGTATVLAWQRCVCSTTVPARQLTSCVYVVALQEFDKFGRAVVDFALLGIPAAVVNSGLKFMQKNLELSFQQR